MTLLAVIGVSSVMGCVATPPPPPAYAVRAGEPVAAVQWQQFCEQATSVSQASWLVSSRGSSGWELVGMSGGVLCYKRPLTPEPPPPSALSPVLTPSAPVLVGAQTMTQASSTPSPARTSTVPSIIDPGF